MSTRRYKLRSARRASNASPPEEKALSARRLFGRSRSSTAVTSPAPKISNSRSARVSTSGSEKRRSFLAHQPSPGAAKRVLAVINQTPRRASTHSPVRDTNVRTYPDGTVRREVVRFPGDVMDDDSQSSLSASPRATALETEASVVSDEPSSNEARAASPVALSTPSPARVVGTSAAARLAASPSPPASTASSASRSTAAVDHRVSFGDNDVDMDYDEYDFQEDSNAGFMFGYVGAEEGDIPSAPNPLHKKIDVVQSWAAYDERIRVLQLELDTEREQSRVQVRALENRNRDLESSVEALRSITADKSAEVEDLGRQLKDTRKRLTRRIREIEDEAAVQRADASSAAARCRSTESQLRAEVDMLRAAHQRTTTLPKRSRAPPNIGSSASTTSLGRFPDSHRLSPVRPDRTTPNELDIDPISLTTAPAAPMASMGGRVRSFQGDKSRGRPSNSIRGGHAEPDYRSPSPARRRSSASSGEFAVSQRAILRRSVLRRALVSHIHSSRYRTMRMVWYDFFGANGGTITRDEFCTALKLLPAASQVTEFDIDALREEVRGDGTVSTNVDGNISWAMFVRFYQRTKNDN